MMKVLYITEKIKILSNNVTQQNPVFEGKGINVDMNSTEIKFESSVNSQGNETMKLNIEALKKEGEVNDTATKNT